MCISTFETRMKGIMQVVGAIHLLHYPALIGSFVLFSSDSLFCHLYLFYFYGIMLSYTFTNGECPLSYISRLIYYQKLGDICYDSSFMSMMTRYPEMVLFFPDDVSASRYFQGMTTMYIGSIGSVMVYGDVPLCFIIIPTAIISHYYLWVEYGKHWSILFELIQEDTRWALITVLFVYMSYIGSAFFIDWGYTLLEEDSFA